MRWNIIVECVGEDGQRSTITLGTIERLAASTTAENLGVNLRESKQIANRLQDTVVKQQLQEHCEQRRKCPTCGKQRPVKDLRCRRLDTVLGTVRLMVPRYRYCKCGCDTQVCNPISKVLSGRVTPELRHLQVSLGAQISYRKAAALLRMFLPPMGGTTHTITRSRVNAVGERIDEQIQREIAENRKPDTLDRGACRSAEDVGLQLADAKPIIGRLQEIVVSEQLQRYCEAVRPCPRCHRRRHLKDYRRRRFDTVFGRLGVRAPRLMAAVIVVNDSSPLRYRNCCPSG